MPNGMGYGRQPGEYSKTGIENKITIPWRTYLMIGLIGTLAIIWLLVAAWCLWLTIRISRGSGFWQWTSREWWPWLSRWWAMILFAIALWWGIIPTIPTLWRFIIEQFFEWLPPTYQPVNLDEAGPWPFGKKRKSRYDEFYSRDQK